jgi:hypothetical protein
VTIGRDRLKINLYFKEVLKMSISVNSERIIENLKLAEKISEEILNSKV